MTWLQYINAPACLSEQQTLCRETPYRFVRWLQNCATHEKINVPFNTQFITVEILDNCSKEHNSERGRFLCLVSKFANLCRQNPRFRLVSLTPTISQVTFIFGKLFTLSLNMVSRIILVHIYRFVSLLFLQPTLWRMLILHISRPDTIDL